MEDINSTLYNSMLFSSKLLKHVITCKWVMGLYYSYHSFTWEVNVEYDMWYLAFIITAHVVITLCTKAIRLYILCENRNIIPILFPIISGLQIKEKDFFVH